MISHLSLGENHHPLGIHSIMLPPLGCHICIMYDFRIQNDDNYDQPPESGGKPSSLGDPFHHVTPTEISYLYNV